MKKTAIILMAIAITSKILGFGREMTLAYFYGASNISDAYLLSMSIPMAFFGFVVSAISTSFIPIYYSVEENLSTKDAEKFTSNLVNLLLMISVIFFGLGMGLAGPLVKLFAMGFIGETYRIAVTFTRIAMFGIFFSCLISLFTGYLQIKGNFVIPALIGFPMNIIVIASIVLSIKSNIYVLVVGTVLATISQFALIGVFVAKEKYRHSAIINIKDEYIKRIFYISVPLLLGSSVSQINMIVDRTIASGIVEGGISALSYANKLNGFITGIFIASITTVIYPNISKMIAQNNMEEFKSVIKQGISVVNIILIPAIVGIVIFSDEIVRLVYRRGAFSGEAAVLTSGALLFYSLGMLGGGINGILTRAFFSMQDTKTPTINGAIAVILNIILNIILSRFMGINGLALATSIATTFSTLLLFVSLRKRIGPFGMRDISLTFVKILGASLVMGVLARGSYGVLVGFTRGNFALLCAVVVGVLIYVGLVYFLKIKEVDMLVAALKKRII